MQSLQSLIRFEPDGHGEMAQCANGDFVLLDDVLAALSTPPAPRAPSIEPVGDDSIKLSVKRDEWEQLSPAAQKKLEEIVWKGAKEYRRQQAEGRAAILDKPLFASPSLAAPASAGVEEFPLPEPDPGFYSYTPEQVREILHSYSASLGLQARTEGKA